MENQMQHHTTVNALPMTSGANDGWRPPYEWQPNQDLGTPAIFTHPNFTNGPMDRTAPMDAPITPELFAQVAQMPMAAPHRAVEGIHGPAMALVDQSHWQRWFRVGNEEYLHVAYGPPPPEGSGEAVLPRGPEAPLTTNTWIQNDLRIIHEIQQVNVQRDYERRSRKGKGK